MESIKLALVVESLASGGTERVCVTLANYFVGNGFEVTIYIKSGARKSVYVLDEKVTLKEVVYPRAHRNLLKVIKGALIYKKRLKERLTADNPDIIVTFGVTLAMLAIPIANHLKKPIIVSEHVAHIHTYEKFLESLQSGFTRWFLYRKANCITVLTHYDYDYYKRFLNNVMVMRNPIKYAESTEVKEREKIVLGVGTYDSHYIKGFDLLIKCFPYEQAKQQGWKLVIAGKGNKEHLQTLIDEMGHPECVELLGEVKDMPSLYRRASIFALSSRVEGLPMVLLEAMSYGCACIAFDCISGPAEIISNSNYGILVHPGNVYDFNRQLSHLMSDETLRQQLSTSGQTRAMDFRIPVIGEAWMALFNKILNERK